MFRTVTPAAAGLLLALLPGVVQAIDVPPYENHVVVPGKSFSTLALPVATARVNGLGSDGINRVWVATPSGVSALQAAPGGTVADPASLLQRAPFFPFDTGDGLVSDNTSAVAFAPVQGDENFFLGFLVPPGLQYGRVIGTSGLSLPSDTNLYAKEGFEPVPVNDLASAGAGPVWAATNQGLDEWNTAGESPAQETTFETGEIVPAVAVSDNDPSTAAFVTRDSGGDRIWTVTSGDTTPTGPLTLPAGVNNVVDLTYDGAGSLWVLGHGSSDSANHSATATVWKYPDLAAAPTAYPFTGPGGTFVLRALGVDDEQGAVWVGTSSSAWFQPLDIGGDLTGPWSDAGLTGSERDVYRVLADPGGNLWIGTGQGVSAFLIRLLSLDNSTYIGYGTPLVVQVIDLAAEGDSIQVEIQGGVRTVPETSPGAGVFARTFTFVAENPDDDEELVAVSSSAEGVEVEVRYGYDPADAGKVLTAVASWSNKQSFEDDFWIGGPCFLDALCR